MANILAVDDEKAILNMIESILVKDSHTVTKIDEPTKIEMDKLSHFDLILLDVMMPGIDGFELCSKIRNVVDCPILFITAKTDEGSLVNGLALGADDYICKPFGVMELRARIGAHLRREKREHVARLALGRICFMLEARKMMIDEKEISLTKAEYDICEFLAKNRGQIFSKEQIYTGVWGYDGICDDNSITVYVNRIREKLSKYGLDYIKTVWGAGYKFSVK